MTVDELIEILRLHVRDVAVKSTIAMMESPAVRDERAVRLHEWYVAQPTDVRAHVHAAVRHAAYSAVFGVAAILSGSRTVVANDDDGLDEELEDAPPVGHFELHYVDRTGRRSRLAAGVGGPALHELVRNAMRDA